ncbi:MbcA/ParS/Xre antitoxin family protein [Oceanicoccus sagamiensis]|uniref:XRE family transcriptional regulator n=1 Tax=Oceanicoccus sagamiensis TaxID=716816 RepID=A0A1X9NCZ6_9GAMM|nr:MbcA/ParS/Xre antitoxin family protein [Oceanicoccus sagamiensis]ARN75918.1 XRE family transcriptional regulator [Oceanicoccus sagamiensis]
MSAAEQRYDQPDPQRVLLKALLNAGKNLGLSKADIGKVIGKDRTSLNRGIAPSSKSGELALFLIRCYRALYVLVGGKPEDIKHWMNTYNHHIQAVPTEEIYTIQGLTRVLEYLDAIRGKI